MLGALKNCFGVNMGHKVLMNYTLIKTKKSTEECSLSVQTQNQLDNRYNHVA